MPVSPLIDIVVTTATVIAVLIAGWELRSGTKISGQTHARDAWLRYLECGFQNPQFGSTALALRHCSQPSAASLWEIETNDSERYFWFLDLMMEAAESLVNYFPEKEWENTIKYNISLHKEAIIFLWDGEKNYYSERLVRIVTEVIEESE